MDSNFYLVHKSILPDNIEEVIAARELIDSNGMSICDACKKCGISRNTYYKYKDFVFKPASNIGRRCIMSFKVDDMKGVLSPILSKITERGANIITINQETPIQGIAYILITMNIIDVLEPMDELIDELQHLQGVKHVEIIAYE